MAADYNLILRRKNRIIVERIQAESEEEATDYALTNFGGDILLQVIELEG